MRLPRSCCLCGAALDEGVLMCAPCQSGVTPQRGGAIGVRLQCVDEWCAPYDYVYPVDVLIRRLKYHGALYLAAPLSYELARCCKDSAVDGIVAIPQSTTAWRRRGYNPALEIARRVARAVGRPLWAQGLRRTRDARVQAGLGRVARQRNVGDLFACNMNVQGLWVAVVDDVSTSGATLSAVANVLKEQGARRVSAWVLAHTPAPDESI